MSKLLRNADTTEMSCLLYRSSSLKKKASHSFFPSMNWKTSRLSDLVWSRDVSGFYGKNEWEIDFRNSAFTLFQVWLTELHFAASFSRRQTRREPFNATSLLLTEKKKKLFVYIDTVQIHGGPYGWTVIMGEQSRTSAHFHHEGRETSDSEELFSASRAWAREGMWVCWAKVEDSPQRMMANTFIAHTVTTSVDF